MFRNNNIFQPAMNQHTYTTSKEFITKFEFDFMETYSFCRDNEPGFKPNGIEYILQADGSLHPTADHTHTFQRTDPQVAEFLQIMQTEIKEVPAWMCAPYYRDAVLFYDSKGTLITALNICLSCEYMETTPRAHINADAQTYVLLKQFFLSLGHHVEDKFSPLPAK